MGTDWERVTRKPRTRMTASDLGLRSPDVPEPGAWFLGPKGENLQEMRALLVRTLDAHAAARAAFHPGDPPFIDDATRDRPAFGATIERLGENLDALSRALRASTPMTSYRNQSHMNWDITMPGALGYFAGMMFNPNNVAPEASPVTTALEIEAGRDLCRMLGYDTSPPSEGETKPEPWGHITCDGSVANTEAMWAARNLRFQAAALARAIRLEPTLAEARTIQVTTGAGARPLLLDLEPWDLVNLPNSEILDLPRRMVEDHGVDKEAVGAALGKWSLQAMGLASFQQEVLQGLSLGVVLVPATAHYSWNKGVTILGLGAQALRPVPVDADARMSVPALRRIPRGVPRRKSPVIQLVRRCGLHRRKRGRPARRHLGPARRFRRAGPLPDTACGRCLGRLLRIDAARARERRRHDDPHRAAQPACPDATQRPRSRRHDHRRPAQERVHPLSRRRPVLPRQADDLPHRPYRARGVSRRRRAIGRGLWDRGLKPGAAAAGVALSRTTIPLDRSGYGELLGRCAWNAKRFFIGVSTLPEPGDPFFVIPLPRLPSERHGGSAEAVAEERARLARLCDIPNEAVLDILKADPDLAALFAQIGPDLTVFAYAFNFLDEAGRPNTDLRAMNDLNFAVFEALSVEEVNVSGEVPDVDMLVTSTLIAPVVYGPAFCDTFLSRAKVSPGKDPIRVLISTMQDPWVTDTSKGNFLPELMKVLRRTVLDARATLVQQGA